MFAKFNVLMLQILVFAIFLVERTLGQPYAHSDGCEVSYVTIPGPTVTINDVYSSSILMATYTAIETRVFTYLRTIPLESETWAVTSVHNSAVPVTAATAATPKIMYSVPTAQVFTPTVTVSVYTYPAPAYSLPLQASIVFVTVTVSGDASSVRAARSSRQSLTYFTTAVHLTSYITLHETRTHTAPLVSSALTQSSRAAFGTLMSSLTLTGMTSSLKASIYEPVQSASSMASSEHSILPENASYSTPASMYPLRTSISATVSPSKTTTDSASSAVPSTCGEHGNFTLNWDDEPAFTPTDPKTAPYPPVFNPYHQLFFSNGYAYVPPPNSPYAPVSPPRMAIFIPNTTHDIGSPYAAGFRPGEIGAGPRASINAFWFNAYGAYLGCDDGGPEGCSMDIRGFRWNATSQQEVLVAHYAVTLPPCVGLRNCDMAPVDFVGSFNGLSGIQIRASIGGAPRIFWMDNLRMGWYNNTCAAGLYRLTTRK